MPLPNTVTTIIEHPNNPSNIIELPKQERPKRLLVLVGRKGYDTFGDEEGSPMGKGFWVEGFSNVQWDFICSKASAEWILEKGQRYEFDAHAWLEGHDAYSQRIKDFMLQQLNLNPNKYYVMTWNIDAFKPIPKLYQIQT